MSGSAPPRTTGRHAASVTLNGRSFRDVLSPNPFSRSPVDQAVALLPTEEQLLAIQAAYAAPTSTVDSILAVVADAQPNSIVDVPYSISAKLLDALPPVSRLHMLQVRTTISDNAAIRDIVAAREIVQVYHQPRNELLFWLKSKEARTRLAGQGCTLMGRTLIFAVDEPLSDDFFADFLWTRSAEESSNIFRALVILGCRPVYFNYIGMLDGSGPTSGIVRFYFDGQACSHPLLVLGFVCDQFSMRGKLYSVLCPGPSRVFPSRSFPCDPLIII